MGLGRRREAAPRTDHCILPSDSADGVRLKLFEAPEFFLREQFNATLYAAYSRKLRRRAYVYGHLRYDLWTSVEADPAISHANERPPKIFLGTGVGKASWVRPAVITRQDERIELHCIVRTEDEIGSSSNIALVEWARGLALECKFWTPGSLRRDPVLLANLKRLLRWVSVREPYCDRNQIQNVKRTLARLKTCTVRQLVEQLGDYDEGVVLAALATLILDQGWDSDISDRPFTYDTRLFPRNAR